jgi:hypothetical protein
MRGRGALLVAGLALVAGGCGGSDEPEDGGPSPSPSASPSSATQTPSAGDPTESVPGLPDAPSVEPATGVELEVDGFTVRAPEKWRITNDTPFGVTAVGPVDDGRSGGLLLATFGESQVSLDEAMRFSWQPGKRPPNFQEQPTTVLGGLTAFYYTADGNKFLTEHVMGLWDSGFTIELNISLPKALPAERQQEIVQSIAATYERPGG